MLRLLNLGCGNRVYPSDEGCEVVNHDIIRHRPEIDVTHDLNMFPWPWEDCSFDKIVARTVLEHLRPNLIETVNECWRILAPGGELHIKLPYWNSDHSFLDPTHYWRFSLRTLEVFDPKTEYGRMYSWYTPRKWTIIKGPWMNNAKSSIYAQMRVVK